MTMRWTLAIAVACALFPGAGCGNPCLQGKAKTDEALKQARDAQAEVLAPEILGRAVAAAGRAEQECRTQGGRFFLFRSYRQAAELIGEAVREAESAREQSRSKYGLLRQEALNSRYTAVMTVNDALIALRRARQMKGDARAQALVGRLDALGLALADLQREIDAGKYPEALELGEKIRTEAVKLQGDANSEALSGGSR
jgi:hypothetical protein